MEPKAKQRRLVWKAWLLAVAVLAADPRAADARPPEPTPRVGRSEPSAAPKRFRLAILRLDWERAGLGYDWETAWPLLRNGAREELFAIDEGDVAAYDWQAQRIYLRPEVNRRLLAAYREELRGRSLHPSGERPPIEERLERLEALGSSYDLDWLLRYHGFVVSLDGEPLYGGIVLGQESQMAIDYPVLQAAIDDEGRIVLRPSPIQFSFGSLWDAGSGAVLEDKVHPAVRELAAAFPQARSSVAQGHREVIERFKRRILDPRLQRLFAAR